jgi:hypothetical protein
MCVGSAWVENLFRRAEVDDPTSLTDPASRLKIKVMTSCLSLADFMDEAMSLLIDEGLLELDDDEDDAGDGWKDYPAFLAKADELVEQLKDSRTLIITAGSFEWVNGFNDRPQDAGIKYFHELTMEDTTKGTKTLAVYCELNMLLGPRSLEDGRITTDSQFYQMVGGGGGGQLTHAVKTYYYQGADSSLPTSPAFLLNRLPAFLIDSQWPEVYKVDFMSHVEYAFDLPGRARWKFATRQEWAAFVQPRLARAITNSLPTIKTLFHDYLDDPTKLVREVQSLGELVLAGADSEKYVFWKIEEVEAYLLKHHKGLIDGERAGGANTASILDKLRPRLGPVKATEREAEGDASSGMRAPKPSQLAKATSQAGFTKVEVKHTPTLEKRTATTEQKLDALRDGLMAESVLTKAVILATKGAKLAPYFNLEGSDILALLHEQRHLLGRYFGQTLAWDGDLKAEPPELKFFALDQAEVDKICNFEWHLLDILNKVILVMRGKELGTQYEKHVTKDIYRDAEMLRTVTDLLAKIFEAIGYPREVEAAEGVTFRQFMARVAQLQKYAMAMQAKEQAGAFKVIDTTMEKALMAAGAHAKRTIYGISPAQKHLREWLAADEELLQELNETLEATKEYATWRRRMGSIVGEPPVAQKLRGFATEGSKKRDGDDEGQPSRKGGKQPKKTASSKEGSLKRKLSADADKEPSPKGDDSLKAKIFLYNDDTFSNGTRAPAEQAL